MAKHLLQGMEEFKRRSDLFHIDPRGIIVQDGWNKRKDFSDLEELKESIRENGVITPIEVWKNKNSRLVLQDGERRLRSVLMLIQEGVDIQSIPAIVLSSKMGEEERFIRSMLRNEGKRLHPSEEADNYRQLQAWGWNISKIAKKVGKSQTHIRSRLELSSAIDPVKEAVDSKQITIQEASEIVKESDGKVVDQKEALETVVSKPKKERIEERKQRASSPPKENFIPGIDSVVISRDLAERILNWCEMSIKEIGPCEHDANLCVCEEKSIMSDLEMAMK